MRYSINLSFAGAAFHGWQSQPGAASVQQCLEDALGKLLGAKTPVIGAGRTDAGVNAIGYVACFDGPEGLAADDFRYKLNAILPRSVAVASVAPADADFHARFDAVRREYTYFLHREKDPFAEAFSWQCGYPDLDFDAMNAAAALLAGTHDFSCFEKVGADNKTSVCTVFEACWKPYEPTHLALMGSPCRPSTAAEGGEALPGRAVPGPGAGDISSIEPRYWYFRIAADRFLRNMVRAIVGTLVEVGRGKRSTEDFAALILPACPDNSSGRRTPAAGRGALRSQAGESAPGHALFLSKVLY